MKKTKTLIYYDLDKTLIKKEIIDKKTNLKKPVYSKKMLKQLSQDLSKENTQVEILSCRMMPINKEEIEDKKEFEHKCIDYKVSFLNNKKTKNPDAKIILYDDQKEKLLRLGKLKKGIKIINPDEI